MSSILIRVLGAALLVATPVVSLAQPAPRPKQEGPQTHQSQPGNRSSQRTPQRSGPQSHGPSSYGSWNSNWGARPPAPPSHWTKKGDWYRHVRACQREYRSYSARTDTYRTRTGQVRRCRL